MNPTNHHFRTFTRSSKSCAALLAVIAFALQCVPTMNAADAVTDAGATVVIYNEADRESGDLARFYASRRAIPKEQIVGLKCSLK